MRCFAVLCVSVLAACAPTSTPSTPSPESERVRIGGGTQSGLRVTSNTRAWIDTLWTPIDRVWKVLPSVYATLEIPIERYDSEANEIGNSALKLYRRLGKIPLTRYIDCGTTQIGPNADSYEVTLTVLTKLQKPKSDTSTTTVATTVEAMARPIQFRGDFVRCSSKGALEARLMEVLKVHLAP
jgi:hypothetical protein